MWTTFRGHIQALRTLKTLVDDLLGEMRTIPAASDFTTEMPRFIPRLATIRAHLAEHARRFQDDFAPPEEIPLEEAKERVLLEVRRSRELDVDKLAWRLRLTRSVTVKAFNALWKERKIGPSKTPALKPQKNPRGDQKN